LNLQPLNSVYSTPRMKRRYEVWFLRCGLADGSGAWWFRYLLFNPGRPNHTDDPAGMPVQVWAAWFPRSGQPQTFIQGFPFEAAELSARARLPFFFRVADCGIEHDSCWGNLHVDGHAVSWKLRYHSTFGVVLSDKGWIGFSRSPNSNALFSGDIALDGQEFVGEPLAFGVQGHNSGYRHRTYWRWLHAYFPHPHGASSTLEALVYDLPFGMTFRNAIWFHDGNPSPLRRIQESSVVNEPSQLRWAFSALAPDRSPIQVTVEALAPEIHRLPYAKTDCSGTFPVANASLARTQIRFGAGLSQCLETTTGAVLEFGGSPHAA